MVKASSTTPTPTPTALSMKPKKKKGRPPKNPQIPAPSPPKPFNADSALRRSTLRNPNYRREFDDDEDDDERKEKKVKLVVRLPQFDHQKTSQDDSGSGFESDDDRDRIAKKRKINGGSDDAASAKEKNAAGKETGSPLVSGPTTPLPDKKLLVFILDRLQKKDTHGVFSEPVDLNELPDYLDIIEKPMDFGTIRKKLDTDAYTCLEDLEADVFLLCSNAMTYNSQNTVFYRQARSIQELAKRDCENLKREGENGEPQPKVVRRGRPPGNKNQKQKALEASPVDRIGSNNTEPSSDATPVGGDDKAATGSNTYNLRKAPPINRFRTGDLYVPSYQSRNGDSSQNSGGWNDEFPASILRADMKHSKRQFTVDETRRDTYRQFHQPASFANNSTLFSTSVGDTERLVPVGLQDPLSYARSLARFAADLGPVAWQIASKRIESVLPPGVQYGPGWVGNEEAPSQPFSFSSEKQISSNSSAGDANNPYKPITPSTFELTSAITHGPSEASIDAIRKNPNEQKPLQRNGFGGMFSGYNDPLLSSPFQDESWMNLQPTGCSIDRGNNFGKSSTIYGGIPVAPGDVNMGMARGASGTSQQQPDLALQL